MEIGNGVQTEEEIEMQDVYNEVNALLLKKGVTKFLSKRVSRKYAFELFDVKKESEYLQVLYPYTGNSCSHVTRDMAAN